MSSVASAAPPMSIPDSTPTPRRVGRAMAWGVAIGVGAVVLRELVRPREQPARLIDWERVEEIALARCGEPRGLPADPATDQMYEQIAGQLQPLLAEALGPGTAASGSRVYSGLAAVGRRQWVRINIRIFPALFEPLGGLQRPSPPGLSRAPAVGVGQQWKAISKLQAVMSVREGYGNLVMNEVGRRELPHFALLEGAYRRRQEQRRPLERAFLRVTGLEMKMRQYVIGERFCREVRDAGGMELLARAWEGPQWLPTMAEIQRPPLYIERARVR